MLSERFELRLDAELLGGVDRARGDVSRAVWVRGVLEAALAEAAGGGRRGPPGVSETWARRVYGS